MGSINIGLGYEVWDLGGIVDVSFRYVGIFKEDGDILVFLVNISRKYLWKIFEVGTNYRDRVICFFVVTFSIRF